MSIREGRTQQIYHRTLPGGGHVAILATEKRTLLSAIRYEGTLVVERRAEQLRRVGHAPPVVARTTAVSVSAILHELFPLAQSNCELAARCIALLRPKRPAPPRSLPGATDMSVL